MESPAQKTNESGASNGDSEAMFPESPVYEPEEDSMEVQQQEKETVNSQTTEFKDVAFQQIKRKLSDDIMDTRKIQKLEITSEELFVSTENLDSEVSNITDLAKNKLKDNVLPSTSRVLTPVRSSPRKITKRSNSSDISNPKTPKTPKKRPASVDVTKHITPRRIKLGKRANPIPEEVHVISSDSSCSRPSVEFVKEIKPPTYSLKAETIPEESFSNSLNDSQNFHLVLSPTIEDTDKEEKPKHHNSDPVVVKDREEIISPVKVHVTQSEGYNYSDQNTNLSQPKPKDFKGKTTDQESTDSVRSVSNSPQEIISPGKAHSTQSEGYNYSDQNTKLSQPKPKDFQSKRTDEESTNSVHSVSDTPDQVPSATLKLIPKLSNGNSSTPTDIIQGKKNGTDEHEHTPDMAKIGNLKEKRGNIEAFRTSNTTTPSTISPLPNGHSLPMNTPHVPVFDIHVNNTDDGEFLSLYIVRTDNDVGVDMNKEYQRFSKRFTIDPYLADVSSNSPTTGTSPGSVTSGGMINLRTSSCTMVSTSTTSSNRTSDGNFVVPQPPRKSVSNPSTSVKGYDALLKKIQDIFSHMRDLTIDNHNRSSEEKVSIGVQAKPSSDSTLSNGNASPEEVSKYDKATPKSSLKKARVKGRRPLAGKTKKVLLPTQEEEPEYMHGINSPEMVPMNGDKDTEKSSPIKSVKAEKSLVATPKSVSKLKQKKRPISPRPATPVENPLVIPEYPGYPPDTLVLAKWVDKRYYSGKVLEITEPNKYLIRFDDGQTKVLLDDFIIFGDMKTLPLQGQSVYVMVDEDSNYEPGLVLSVEENSMGTITYKCTTDGDSVVMVTSTELYLTEDQAKSLKESHQPATPSTPNTPRRRHRELDLDNIIQGPRSARTREKGNSSARKRVISPKSPKASTSGVKTSKSTPAVSRKRLASESSEMSESSNSAPPSRLEEVAGVEPEVQRTPRKIDGVKAGPLQLKGAAKQNIGKKNSKLTKFENDEDTISKLGPIPSKESKLFIGLCFLLTYTDPPRKSKSDKSQDSRQFSSEEEGDATASSMATDTEDLEFTDRPFNKERLKEQLETGGGTVYSHFDDVPKNKYSVCKLIAPRPCLTAKYIQCLAADIRAVTHDWVIASCKNNMLMDTDAYVLPAGWSIQKEKFVNWVPLSGKRNTTFFKDKVILLCGDQEIFVKFWDRVCTLVGAKTRVVNEEDLNMSGAIALVTEWDCPHEVQNKANQDNIPLVSTNWVTQCLIEARIIPPTSHPKFSFMYTEPE